jgi:hypothetical protein
MRPLRAGLITGLVVFGVLLVAGTALAYREIVYRWGADPRGTLIAAATVGISFFISMNLLLAWTERRRRGRGRGDDGEAADGSDGRERQNRR